MPTDLPSFNSPVLTDAVQETAPYIRRFTQNLDAMSDDIKKLEGYLEASGIRVEVEAPVVGPDEWSESISWSNTWGSTPEQHDRWRIVYLRVRHMYIEGEHADHIADYCPLIETPVAARLRAYRALPELVRQIGQQVTIKPLESDLPF